MNTLASQGMSDEAFQALWERSLTCAFLHAFLIQAEISGRPIADIAVETLIELSKDRQRFADAYVKLTACVDPADDNPGVP